MRRNERKRMSMLDTNTLSFAMAGDLSVCRRMLSQARTNVLLPQPVVAEIEYGLARMRKSKKRERLLGRFRAFLQETQRGGLDRRGQPRIRHRQGGAGTSRVADRGLRCRNRLPCARDRRHAGERRHHSHATYSRSSGRELANQSRRPAILAVEPGSAHVHRHQDRREADPPLRRFQRHRGAGAADRRIAYRRRRHRLPHGVRRRRPGRHPAQHQRRRRGDRRRRQDAAQRHGARLRGDRAGRPPLHLPQPERPPTTVRPPNERAALRAHRLSRTGGRAVSWRAAGFGHDRPPLGSCRTPGPPRRPAHDLQPVRHARRTTGRATTRHSVRAPSTR